MYIRTLVQEFAQAVAEVRGHNQIGRSKEANASRFRHFAGGADITSKVGEFRCVLAGISFVPKKKDAGFTYHFKRRTPLGQVCFNSLK